LLVGAERSDDPEGGHPAIQKLAVEPRQANFSQSIRLFVLDTHDVLVGDPFACLVHSSIPFAGSIRSQRYIT